LNFGDPIGVMGAHELEEFPSGQDRFGDGGADGEHGFVDDLAQTEVHGYAAKEIGVNFGEAPAAGEQIDHTCGCGTRSGGGIGGRFDDDPGVVLLRGPF